MTYKEFCSQIENFDGQYNQDINDSTYFSFPIGPILEAESKLTNPAEKSIAYFSMEYGLAPSIYNSFLLNRPMSEKNKFFKHQVFSNYWISDYVFKINIQKMLDIPIYSGGLGVLAGDTVKSIADMGLSVVAFGILWNKGYFKQNFWYKHGQVPEELSWDPHSYPGLIPLKNRVRIKTKQGDLVLRLWKYYVYSYDKKHVVPLVLLDSNLPDNNEHFRKLTDQLYRSDQVSWRIFQRSILGIGGMKAVDDLKLSINCYHLNEGHAAFALVEKYFQLSDKRQMDTEKKKFVYTCHTPVAAGHDRFGINDLQEIFTDDYVEIAKKFGKENPASSEVNLTHICLDNCRHVNAVAQKHGEIMRLQFPAFARRIDAITNGVHAHTWVSESFANLFDQYSRVFGDWRADPQKLQKADRLIRDQDFRRDIFQAHQVNKRNLLNIVRHWKLQENVLTICWARRITGYKRPSLLFHHVEQVLDIARQIGPLQIIIAGKSHPMDTTGASHIQNIMEHIDRLNKDFKNVKVLILENYDTYFGKLLTNSVDIWLNNPLPPFEASGTSGMKAILNGVLQLSTLDGWVVEAERDDIGWIFGYRHQGPEIGNEGDLRLEEDSKALYSALRDAAGLYYRTNKNGAVDIQSPWIDKMIRCVCRSGFFNTHRMVSEYKAKMWS
ncbi:MAG: alpha-glucan family phosphorylase [Candidatus Omnitrophica bacterium]|nr:alpha-glucan family phosphorylase [Candidatus Omnitrophota bacterium]